MNKGIEHFTFRAPGGRPAISAVAPARGIGLFITPIALAHWIMCDGGKILRGGVFLDTFSFTIDEVDLLYLCGILPTPQIPSCLRIKQV